MPYHEKWQLLMSQFVYKYCFGAFIVLSRSGNLKSERTLSFERLSRPWIKVRKWILESQLVVKKLSIEFFSFSDFIDLDQHFSSGFRFSTESMWCFGPPRNRSSVKFSSSLNFHVMESSKSTGLIRDPRSCSSYFSCVSYLPFEKECPEGFYFNPASGNCEISSSVECNNCPERGVQSIASPVSCTRWTLCVNGHALPQECAPGTFFDERFGACNLAELVECAANTCTRVSFI